jgi:hypothetical protein
MAGGIFPGRQFEFNIKCIIFTALIASGYWYFPYHSIYVLIFLLWIPYVSLAWYDYSYNCENKLKYTFFPFGRYIFLPFKPAEYQKTYTDLTPEQKQEIVGLDHIYGWTILVIGISIYLYYKK